METTNTCIRTIFSFPWYLFCFPPLLQPFPNKYAAPLPAASSHAGSSNPDISQLRAVPEQCQSSHQRSHPENRAISEQFHTNFSYIPQAVPTRFQSNSNHIQLAVSEQFQSSLQIPSREQQSSCKPLLLADPEQPRTSFTRIPLAVLEQFPSSFPGVNIPPL